MSAAPSVQTRSSSRPATRRRFTASWDNEKWARRARKHFHSGRRRLCCAGVKPDEISLNRPAADPRHWVLDPGVVFLNHGAFGACPRRVLECQSGWRARMERQPLQFLVRELEPDLDAARAALAQFAGAEADDLVFVPNATTGVNTVLRSLEFKPGDELLATDHEYNACRNALDFVAERSGARVVVAKLPFPFRSTDELIAPVLECVTSRTRLALLDHVTSQTGMVLPIARLVSELNRRGVDALVDGAHPPGMVDLNLSQLGAAYYTGNCHKWLCAPKGVALLHVRRDRQKWIRPLTISHGANSARTDRSRFLLEFAWPGTWDPSAALSVPEAIRFLGSLLPGGWPEVMARNRALALAARNILCAALEIAEPCPAEFIGALAAVPLPPAPPEALPRPPMNEYPLQDALRLKHRIEVPVISWPAPPRRVLRVSAQLYNALPQYERLARALILELPGA
ncbi:MAG: aminotransferase class V-fold PLP-dependent enzyme [Verrucomicrobiota bacterium]|nr:aminotransferase class V-fold PLP-dependent enzyme [Verrucomicrobiota bacterium]